LKKWISINFELAEYQANEIIILTCSGSLGTAMEIKSISGFLHNSIHASSLPPYSTAGKCVHGRAEILICFLKIFP